MSRFLVTLACAWLCLAADSGRQYRGYFNGSADAEKTWEAKYRAIPQPANMREYMRRLSAKPHHVGSPYDKENAEWILAKLKSWGLDARIETFDVLFPTPRQRVVELVEPRRFAAKLAEPPVPADPTSGQEGQLPVYHAYSRDGDVTAALVYVNYGVPADYEQLERLGISVKGAIVIARYGASWRGIKPKVAAEHGAVGCIIYSDPRDDGYYQGQVFPQGAWRPPDGAQRGSVMDMPVYPGDPLTPGAGATANARRLSLSEVQTLTRIPVLPISYADAQPLLAALNGPVAPENWRGALPITYRIGPGPAKVHLKVQSNWDLKPLYNVIATIRGSQFPDEWVIRGNHHDAWVNGAEDPGSGAMVVLEEARALAELRKQGWNPKRTVVYCFWDGEEPGLLGSTEWGEEHSAQLLRQAAVYINSDANGRGYLGVGGSHSLEHFISDVARDVDDPEKHISVWERSRLSSIANASADERKDIRGRQDLRIGALGSGSDYTVFIDHLGIPSLNIGFGGEDGGGIYHSIYDDFYWYTHFSDTDFVYGRALAQLGGTAVMRMASADVLPFQFANLATTIRRYVDELQKLATQKREEAEERNRQLEEGVFQATADPRETFVPPPKETLPPYVNFAPLLNTAAALTRSAEAYEKAFGSAQSIANPAKLNAQLLQTERTLSDAAGLPRRPWFRHQIYAPGFYTGYGVKTIPGVREALEQKNWTEAEEQIGRVARILQNEASLLDAMKNTLTAR